MSSTSDPSEPVDQASAAPDTDKMTAEQLAEAKEYGRLDLYCTLVDRIVDLVFLATMAFLFARSLDIWLRETASIEVTTLRLAAFYLVMYPMHVVVSFPITFYSGYVLEHRFGLSKQTPRAWFWKYAKQLVIGLFFNLLLFIGLFWVIWLSGPLWWLVAAGCAFLLSIVVGQLAPVVLMPLFYKITKIDDPNVTQRMEKLSQGTGLEIEGVYRMDLSSETVKANAMLAGLGRTRRVIMGDTLLDGFSDDEIDVVFAHEIGHHVFRHIRKMILIGALYSLIGFAICHQVLAHWITSEQGEFDPTSLPIFALPILMLCLNIFSQLLEPLQNAISRHFERQSDQYALDRTANPTAYVSAFQKLAKLNKDDPDPHPVEVFLFHSHPPISQRLAMARQ